MAGDASSWAQGAFGQAQVSAGGASAAGSSAPAGNAAVDGAAGQVQNVVGGAAGGAGAGVDPDKIVEMVEQRLLREIERRGGRWAGVF
jgi:hypothetical protein